MQGQTKYEVWKLVENQGRCYASTDCVEGVSLAAYLKYHPNIPRELLVRWMKEIPRELEKFHRCRGNPCFQYVNPFAIIVSVEKTVHLLNLQSEKQKKLLKKVRRRDVRESFQREDNRYCQRISISDDIYSLGRTYQYILAAVDTVPLMRRRDRRRLRKIIAACLDQEPGRVTGRRVKRQFHDFQQISEQFSKIKTEKKIKYRKKKFFSVLAAALLLFLLAAGKMVSDERERIKRQAEERYKAEKEEEIREINLKYDLGFLYFLDLEDYAKSIEIFSEIAKVDPLGSAYKRLAAYLASEEGLKEEELGELLGQIEEMIPDKGDFRYYHSLVRGYRLLGSDASKQRVIEIAEHCLKLEGWKAKDEDNWRQKEILRELASAYEQTLQTEQAVRVYQQLLELEQEAAQREGLYEKLVLLHEDSKNPELAWEVCTAGIEELEWSSVLRILSISMQCKNSAIDRQICAQTIQKYLKEVPDISSSQEFKRLKEIYDIKVEGENVWVGR